MTSYNSIETVAVVCDRAAYIDAYHLNIYGYTVEPRQAYHLTTEGWETRDEGAFLLTPTLLIPGRPAGLVFKALRDGPTDTITSVEWVAHRD